jgi:hypothetical protein
MSNAGGITTLNLKLYYKGITIKTAWCWHKNRQEGLSIRRPRHKPMQYSQLIFGKGAKIHNGEKTASSTNVAGKSGFPHVED